jgi:hypothetical protein
MGEAPQQLFVPDPAVYSSGANDSAARQGKALLPVANPQISLSDHADAALKGWGLTVHVRTDFV